MTEQMATLVQRMECLSADHQKMLAELFLRQIESELQPTLVATDELELLLAEAKNEIKAGAVFDMEEFS